MSDLSSLAYQRAWAAARPRLRFLTRRVAMFIVAGIMLVSASLLVCVAAVTALAKAVGVVGACLITALTLATAGGILLILLRRPSTLAVPPTAIPRDNAARGISGLIASTLLRELLAPRYRSAVLAPALVAVGAGVLTARLQARRRRRY